MIDEMMTLDVSENSVVFKNNLKQAQSYYEEHGNLAVSQSSGSLGTWISVQRQNYKDQKLTLKQIYDLNAIGMIWDAKKNQVAVSALCEENGISFTQLWRKLLGSEIEESLTEEEKNNIQKQMAGNSLIPISFLEVQAKIEYLKEQGISLIQADGTLHSIFTMNSKKLKEVTGMSLIELEDKYIVNPKQMIDEMMTLDVSENNVGFKTNLKQAQAYYEKHGNLAVPAKFGSLGTWIGTQRTNYKNQKLTPEQIHDLNATGMIWEVKSNKKEVEDICAENGILLDKKSPLYKKSATELRCKIAYLQSIDVPIFEQTETTQKLNPIFFMSDVDMQEKFQVSMSDLVRTYGKQEGVTK